MNKIKFKVKTDKFGDFLKKLEDLTKISPTIKLKIDNDDILIYSVLGKAAVLAFKNYTFKFQVHSSLHQHFLKLMMSYKFEELLVKKLKKEP